MFLRFLFITFSLFALTCPAQTTRNWQEVFRQWIEDEDMESASWEELFEELSERAEHPINLNQATREELEQLPFLTPQQVEQLVSYVYRYGPIRSIGELQMLTSLDPERRHLLEFFVYIGAPLQPSSRLRIDSVLRHSKHQLTLTGRIPTYHRKGDNNAYLGYRYRHTLRYQLTYHERLKLGLTGAQDAGEPFFSNRNTLGYDYYSYYLQLRDIGRIENLCLGMYRVQLGMGLIMNGGFSLGKTAILQSFRPSTTVLHAHSSRSTTGYLQGIAATIRLQSHWHWTFFASYRPLDATLNKDSTARTLLTSSYHRTKTEIGKKNNTHEIDFGSSIGWHKGTLYAKANIVHTHLDRQLLPEKEKTLYRRYAAEGNNFLNISIDYGYTNTHLFLCGETAVNRQGAIAAIHQLSYRLSPALNMTILHRYYDKRYTSLHARSFSEGSSIQNEHGIYAGLIWQPSPRLTLNWYADYTHFPFARYQVSMPSDAFDTMLLARTLLYNKWKLEVRYRLHLRQKDNEERTWLINRTEHRARLRISHETHFGLSLQTQADGVFVSYHQHDKGWMASEQATYQWRWLQLSANAAYFHTDNYESRLYLYERPMLYELSSLMLYGKGIRYALMSRADIGKHLMLTAKIGSTNYFDRSKISSGYQEINGSSMTDIDIQVRWKF